MTQTSRTPALTPDYQTGQKPTNFRWAICGLLFYATTINYVDRSVFGVLAEYLQKIIGWSDWQFGLINAAFTLAYAVGFLIMGRLIDTFGTRIGYAIALTLWTIAGALTALAGSPFAFGMARFGLGIGEAGNFPAAVKTTAEWFPQRQRATATGIFNAGSNVGAILAPFLVPFVVFGWGAHVLSVHPELATQNPIAGVDPKVQYGWPAAFLITPILAAIWIFLWLTFYRTPQTSRFANAAEVALIQGDGPVAVKTLPVKWHNILPHRQAWAFMMGKFLTDPIWWFYLFWSGKFFAETFHVNLKGLAGPLILIYVLADFGSVLGGYYSSWLIKRGWTVNAARKTAFLTCAICILPVILVPKIKDDWIVGPGGMFAGVNIGMWLAATLIGIAASAHQGFSANIFTTTSDMFPKRAVSSVVALGGLSGALSGMVMQAVAGVIKEVTQSYLIMFVIAGSVYMLAVVVIHLLAPRMEPVREDVIETTPMPRTVTAVIFGVLGFVIGVPLSFLFQNASFTLAGVPKALGTAAATLPADTLAQLHQTLPKGFSFSQYIASILSGDVFKSIDHAGLVTPLIATPLISLATCAVLGMIVHPFLFPNRPTQS